MNRFTLASTLVLFTVPSSVWAGPASTEAASDAAAPATDAGDAAAPDASADESAGEGEAERAPAKDPATRRAPNRLEPPPPPPDGHRAAGGSTQQPLPPAPPPVSKKKLRKGPWRGKGWVAPRFIVTGPLGGDRPALPEVVSAGGGFDAGWRANNWFGLGGGLTLQAHDVVRTTNSTPFGDEIRVHRGYVSDFDFLFFRFYVPNKGIAQPWLDIGGGVALYDPALNAREWIGGNARGAVGLDLWLGRSVTLGLSAVYRMTFLDDSIGHRISGGMHLGFHF